MAYDKAGQERKLQLQELEELCLEAYENSRIYKEKVKQFHDSRILRKEFKVGQKVLLFNSWLKLIAGKLHSKWDGLFVVTNIPPYGTVEVRDEANNRTFKVNGHQLKPYYEGPNLSSNGGKVEFIELTEPVIPEDTLEDILESLIFYIVFGNDTNRGGQDKPTKDMGQTSRESLRGTLTRAMLKKLEAENGLAKLDEQLSPIWMC
ncbi:hypothetical protein CR513_31521, partial [Mucuna pruriens]